MRNTSHTDWVIVGSGVAGLSTALFATLAAQRAVVLEKTDLVGGCSCWSHGATWVGNNSVAREAGISDDPSAVAAYMAFLGAGENEPGRTATLIERGPVALDILRRTGIHFDLVDGANDILAGRAPGAVSNGRTLEPRPLLGGQLGGWRSRLRTPPDETWRLSISEYLRARKAKASEVAAVAEAVGSDRLAQGPALVARLLLALCQRQVPIRTGTPVRRLCKEEDRVMGVELADGTRILARCGVMIATGNYLSNSALVSALEGLPEYRSWSPEGNTGDGIHLAAECGAAVGLTRNNRMIMLGYADPEHASDYYAGEPSGMEIPRAHTMVVNKAGQRFGNEGLFQEMAPAIRALDPTTRRPKNLPCWLVFDTQYVDAWGFAGSARGTVPSWVPRAATLNELGVMLGIDPTGLASTAARFNEFAHRGVDEDFGRKPGWAIAVGGGAGPNPSLGSIAHAPFFGVRLRPTGNNSAGLRCDAEGRVVNWRGEPISGLYAAGDATQHDEFGPGYQAGVTFLSAFTFPYLAVESTRTRLTPGA